MTGGNRSARKKKSTFLLLMAAESRHSRMVYPCGRAPRHHPSLARYAGGQLARARARGSPARLRPAVQPASLHRWTGMLAVAAQCALAYSLLELPFAAADECDGTEPLLGDLLADARDTEPVPASRLPAPC